MIDSQIKMVEMAKLLLYAVTFISFSTLPALSQNEEFKIMPEFKELLLKVGAKQDLNCSVISSDSKASLKWTFSNADGKTDAGIIEPWVQTFSSGGTFTVKSGLQIVSFDVANAGDYRCSLIKNGTESDYKVISLSSFGENKIQPVFEENVSPVTLSCSLSFETNISIADITWLKVEYKNGAPNDQLVSSLKDSSRFTEVDENSTLIITNPKLEDAGLYIARFKFQDQRDPYDCTVDFQAWPLVQDFDKAKNLIEGDKMELHCIVKGHPPSVVTWYKGSTRLNITDSRHTVMESLDNHQTVQLLIKNVEFSDEGDYTCEAYSVHFNQTSKKTVTVRVKDKLAALWPFLGIVGEVVVLCTIIFIYEKRRNKQVQLEEKAAEEVDGSATDKKEGLRHRTTNNPSA